MASTSKCPHCGGVIRSDEKTCPHCGAENRNYSPDTPRTIYQPKTIAELKEYCAERGMPLLRMRFFIGEDYREPKAFGIYRDGKDVVVYKNKADGSRAVRYRGADEAYAVNELFQKLLSECHNRGIYPDGEPLSRSAGGAADGESFSRPRSKLPLLLSLAFGAATILSFPIASIWLKNSAPPVFHFLGLACILLPLLLWLRWVLTTSGHVRSFPFGTVILGVLFLSAVLLLSAQGARERQEEVERIQRQAEYERLHVDDGYYDFGDGYIYYSDNENWYSTSDFFEDAVWDYDDYTWHMPDGSKLYGLESLWDPAGSTRRTAGGLKTFDLRSGSHVTLRLADGTVPEETQKAFLGKSHDLDWPFGEFSTSMLRENAHGYYDFGDGALLSVLCLWVSRRSEL